MGPDLPKTIFVVAPNWGGYEGWRQPYGAYSTEEKALAAIGRAVTAGTWYAEKLRVVALDLDAPLNPQESPDADR
jgi:hypothetical protein